MVCYDGMERIDYLAFAASVILTEMLLGVFTRFRTWENINHLYIRKRHTGV